MAMLMMNDLFQRTWGERAGKMPHGEYWPELTSKVRAALPGFLFMAEAYLDLEWQLQPLGCAFCHAPKPYSRIATGPRASARRTA